MLSYCEARIHQSNWLPITVLLHDATLFRVIQTHSQISIYEQPILGISTSRKRTADPSSWRR